MDNEITEVDVLTMEKVAAMPLALLAVGEKAEVVKGYDGPAELGAPECGKSGCCGRDGAWCRAEDMGLRIGKTVEVLNSGGGPMLLKVDGSRLAVARRLAMKIMVRRVER